MKVKLNITIDEEIKIELLRQAKEKGIKPSHLISIWVSENKDKH